MEKTILDEFNENPKILSKEKFNTKKLDVQIDNSFEITTELLDELHVPKENLNTMKFIFYELTGNIYDHSKFSEACISGRKNKDNYDFIFKDNGISILASFKNANFYIENDCDALIKAVNGLSTKKRFRIH